MLSDIKGVGEATQKKLNELGIFDEYQLVFTLPRSYIDMDAAFSLEKCVDGDICAFEGVITSIGYFKKDKFSRVQVSVNAPEIVKIIWYNQPYYAKTLKKGEKYRFYGKIHLGGDFPQFFNPQIDVCDGTKLEGIHPVYRTKGILSQGVYENIVQEALKTVPLQSIIPSSVEQEKKLIPFGRAIVDVHLPTSLDLEKQKYRIKLEKVVKRICAFRLARSLNEKQLCRAYSEKEETNRFIRNLPFSLSPSQRDTVQSLIKTLTDGKSFNAILCGDVGSGKTIVSVILAFFVILNGYKVYLMAPTSILAYQHFDKISKLFEPYRKKVLFLSGAVTGKAKKELLSCVQEGDFDMLIGTHALLNDALSCEDLGLVITDEQHRFGVAQRTKLLTKGKDIAVLTMSATPIPRSLRLVAYGEMDFYTIERERRSCVKTRLVFQDKREAMWGYVGKVSQEGFQTYIVAPRIVDVEGIESDSVEKLVPELSNYVPRSKIGVLYGKMTAEEKQGVLERFYKREISVLISTTVVEVGIDVPNATVMIICDAERFGLATLHQLRGRIGRGDKDGYCFLYTEKEPSEGLKTLVSCSDGMAIAEADYALRGGGDIFGLEQSGGESLDGLSLRILKEASEIADRIDVEAISDRLTDEIKAFSLSDVSLT